MKFHFAYVLSYITAALAQSIAIGTPIAGQTLHVGQPFNVMAERPVSTHALPSPSEMNEHLYLHLTTIRTH
jgi:hypothetical protein